MSIKLLKSVPLSVQDSLIAHNMNPTLQNLTGFNPTAKTTDQPTTRRINSVTNLFTQDLVLSEPRVQFTVYEYVTVIANRSTNLIAA